MVPEECSTSAGKEKKLLSRTSRSIGVTDSSVKSYTHSETGHTLTNAAETNPLWKWRVYAKNGATCAM